LGKEKEYPNRQKGKRNLKEKEMGKKTPAKENLTQGGLRKMRNNPKVPKSQDQKSWKGKKG